MFCFVLFCGERHVHSLVSRGSQRTICGSWFFPTMWVPGTELWSPGSMAIAFSDFTHWAISWLLSPFWNSFINETENPQKGTLISPVTLTFLGWHKEISTHSRKREHTDAKERVPTKSRLVNQSIYWGYLQEHGGFTTRNAIPSHPSNSICHSTPKI